MIEIFVALVLGFFMGALLGFVMGTWDAASYMTAPQFKKYTKSLRGGKK